MRGSGWNQSGRDQQDMWDNDDYVSKKQHQFEMLKAFATTDGATNWENWTEEKKKRELRELLRVAWYLHLAESKGLTSDSDNK